MPKVIVQFGGEEWTVDLREGVNVAGRSPQAGIPIRDASMSREHCEIVLEGSVATVVDRGSMNGTLVNGTKTDRKVLVPGDKIQIGKASIFFEEKTGGAPATKTAKGANAPAAAVVGLDDFSVWRKESGGGLKIVVALVVLVLLGGGAVLMFKSLRPAETVAADPGNLLGTLGRFDPGTDRGVPGWVVKPGQASRIQIIEGSAKQGKTSLQVEKSSAAGDLVAEVLAQEILTVPPSAGPLEVAAWVSSESTSILPALKATWMAARKGPVLVEEASEPAPGSSGWTQLNYSFPPPPGATHVQISLLAVGRGGRVQFDDVRAKFGSGAASTKSATFSGYTVQASRAGALTILQGSRRVITNAQLFLSSEKDGTMPQVAAAETRVELADASKKLTAAGKLPSPVDLRAVDFEIEAWGGKDSLLLGYRLKGDALKQVDRVGLSMLLPGATVKGDYSSPVFRLWFRSGDAGDSILEMSEGVMRVTADWVPGEARRAVLTLEIPKNASELAVGFVLKAGSAGQLDPVKAIDQAKNEGRMADALELAKDLLAATREDGKRETVQKKLREIEEIEAADWQAVQSARFMAELVGLKPSFDLAVQAVDQYEKRWPARRAEAIKAERAKITAGAAGASEDRESVRAQRLVDRAEQHLKEGRKLLARELCETVRRHYPQSPAAAKAADVLKRIGSE